MLKQAIALGGVLGLLSSCHLAKSNGENVNCPATPQTPSPLILNDEGDFYNALQTIKITANQNTLTFKSQAYDFIYCRGDGTWSVQSRSDQPSTDTSENPDDYQAYLEKLANPPYEVLTFNNKAYQYRLLLDPNPFPNWLEEPERVIFEILPPDASKPQRYTLYTLDQVKRTSGIQLGVPRISATRTYDNRLYWAIAQYKGEGASGIATIVSYAPKTEEITIIQPKGLERQQIQDFVITEKDNQPIFWLATQTSGEGNPFLSGLGLVAYDPQTQSYRVYHRRNSPLVGAIPHQLKLERDYLWVSTANGICQLNWENPDDFDNWNCWRLAIMAKAAQNSIPLYPNSLTNEAQETLNLEQVEILWWTRNTDAKDKSQGRYEVVYPKGFTVTLPEQGATPWEQYEQSSRPDEGEKAPLYWAGKDWHWNGERFIRPFDAVSLNLVGGGSVGISVWSLEKNGYEHYAIRGALEVLNLTEKVTTVRYYSAWVDDDLLMPYITLIPQEKVENPQQNPLIQGL